MRAALLLALLLCACAPHVDRDEWLRMSTDDKHIYVNSLVGAQAAAHAKGGLPLVPHGTTDEIIASIDEHYARGDERTPDEIFATLPARRPQQP